MASVILSEAKDLNCGDVEAFGPCTIHYFLGLGGSNVMLRTIPSPSFTTMT